MKICKKKKKKKLTGKKRIDMKWQICWFFGENYSVVWFRQHCSSFLEILGECRICLK